MFIRQIKIPQSAVSEPVGITREIPTLTHTINLIVAASYRVPGIARRAVRVLHPFYERFIHFSPHYLGKGDIARRSKF